MADETRALIAELARMADEKSEMRDRWEENKSRMDELKRALIAEAGEGGGALQGAEHVVVVGPATSCLRLAVRLARDLLQEDLGEELMLERRLLVETQRRQSVRLVRLVTPNGEEEGK